MWLKCPVYQRKVSSAPLKEVGGAVRLLNSYLNLKFQTFKFVPPYFNLEVKVARVFGVKLLENC